MSSLEDFFDGRIFCINLASRPDRWVHVQKLCTKFGFNVTRFEGVVGSYEGQPNGNHGCTSSHRALLDFIAAARMPRALILEDDFDLLHVDFMDKFAVTASELPDNWDFFFLGAHYAEKPIGRHSEHLIRTGALLTTSSYGITWQMAERMRESITGVGPIDSLYGQFQRENLCYCAEPRLIVQYANPSDLQGGRFMDNSMAMLDKESARP